MRTVCLFNGIATIAVSYTHLDVYKRQENIRVNAVRPGLIYTDLHEKAGEKSRVDRLKHMVPMQRGGMPEEVAKAILWLASDDASYITGSILNVSGGR